MSRSGPYRLPHELARTLRFTFDGRRLAGFEGDTLAAALLANGVRTVGRSFKFHRPRGIYSCGVEEPNALLQLGSGPQAIPSSRATLIALHEGLEAVSNAGWPGRRFDIGRCIDLTASLWSAGFYNKTFKWPSWHVYEPFIRKLAGCGHPPTGPDPDRYETRHLHCDFLIIGGGAAGLRQAVAAAQSSSRIVLVEQDVQLGGRAAWDGRMIEGASGSNWVRALEAQLRARDNVRILAGTTAVGCYEGRIVTLVESIPPHAASPGAPRERYWIVRAQKIILATGAIEQPLVFCNNDRPGILLASAAHQYLHRYCVAIGRRLVVATNNDSAYVVARDLKQAGVNVVAVADSRHDIPVGASDLLRGLSIPVLPGSIPVDTDGFTALSRVSIGKLSRDSSGIESTRRYACDALAISGGWNPALQLYSQAGGKLIYDECTSTLEPATSHPRVSVAESAESAGASPQRLGVRVSPTGPTHRQWVDLRHDVTVADLELALRENYTSIEHIKRYTTVGMAADQGKTSNVPALEIIARLRGVRPVDIGHTTLRPPFMPVTLGAIVGRAVGDQFAPSRRTPMHDWHAAQGAVMEDYGEWKRPAVYLRERETRDQAIGREALAVRTSAGLLDGSTLGKIEVEGPDALAFLDRFYINNLATLKPGRTRYGFMLRETGTIFDDGTVVMLRPDHLLITTTSGNANRVTAWLEEWHQCEWPHLRVVINQVTDHWATISLTGPRARDILSRLDTDVDLSNGAFPHLGMREGTLAGLPTRLYRVSFTGELTYEINVPAGEGERLWKRLLDLGKPEGLEPFGVEALLLMRLEKGFLHLGSDTDGTTVPDDVGYGKLAASKSSDFIGKRSLRLPEHVRPDRLQLVGLKRISCSRKPQQPVSTGTYAALGPTNGIVSSPTDASSSLSHADALVVGSHLGLPDTTEPTDGWITSAGRSVANGDPVALALLRGGRAQLGAIVSVHDGDRMTRAEVVKPVFYDAAGDRMNA